MKARAAAIASVVGITTLFGVTAAGAAETLIKVPAPPAVGTATGLRVGNIVTVGGTGAAASSTQAGAAAVPVSVLGHPIVGGSQVGTGSKSGALIDTGSTPLGRVQVAPYSVSAAQSPTSRSAEASAAAARLDVLNPDVIHIDVLQSSSKAVHTGPLSVGQAVSDGVVLRIGGPNGTVIRILHSESDATGHGRTYLLAVGDNAILDQDFLGAACSLHLASALNVACLRVAGGVGGLTASVLQAAIGNLTAAAITATGAGGHGVDATNVLGSSIEAPRSAGSPLARTGVELWFAGLLAVAIIALGAATLASTKAPALLPVRVKR